jgi:tetratricopeptide (TPR) repeat protein
MMRQLRFHALASVLILLLAACATEEGQHDIVSDGGQRGVVTHADTRGQSTLETKPVAPQELPVNYIPPPPPSFNGPKTIEESGASAAVLSLYKQAQQARAAKKFDHAEGALNRALRIDPRNAFIWQALANLHLAQHQYDFAENEAQKSTSLGRGNPYIEATNLHILADVHEAHGDAAGALQARTKADDLLSNAPAASSQ